MLNKSLEYIKQQIKGISLDTALILGSGLDGLSAAIENPMFKN